MPEIKSIEEKYVKGDELPYRVKLVTEAGPYYVASVSRDGALTAAGRLAGFKLSQLKKIVSGGYDSL